MILYLNIYLYVFSLMAFQVPITKETHVPTWKKIWKPVWEKVWVEEHHEHHDHHGWN